MFSNVPRVRFRPHHQEFPSAVVAGLCFKPMNGLVVVKPHQVSLSLHPNRNRLIFFNAPLSTSAGRTPPQSGARADEPCWLASAEAHAKASARPARLFPSSLNESPIEVRNARPHVS